MKKQAMSLAVTAALLGGAVSATGQSMYINGAGTGEVLIYPFYSANGGNDTQVHIVNTTDDVKAVKVRFIEGQNSQEVLDFNLYLSPQDEWAAVITSNPLLCDECDGAIVRTVDNSCTVPALGTGDRGTQRTVTLPNGTEGIERDQAFVNFEYLGDLDESFARTTEGYVEMIEMGQLNPAAGLGAAAVHNENGVPADCAALVAAWEVTPPGVWSQAPVGTAELLTWNGGGLYGYSVLINVDQGTAVGVDATAIDQFADTELGDPGLHTPPSDIAPGLFNGVDFATIFDNGVATVVEMNNGRDAVSALFMTEALVNDYVIDENINGQTDWVITMPTKREYVQGVVADAPFTNVWNGAEACEQVEFETWDREEAFVLPPIIPGEGPGFSPAPPPGPGPEPEPGFNLCTEVNVVTFGTESAVDASTNIRYGVNDFLEYTQGWGIIDFSGFAQDPVIAPPGRILTGAQGDQFFGLPTMGFAVFEYTNGDLSGGALANYAAAADHKTVESPDLD
jgi:hypothetical protein